MTVRCRSAMLAVGLSLTGLYGPAYGQTLALPCRPPLDIPLRLTLEQGLPSPEGSPVRITVERRLIFGRDEAGLFLDSTAPVMRNSDKGARAQRLAGLYAPQDGRPMRLRLDESGHVVGIAGEAEHWGAFLALQRGLIAPDGSGDMRVSHRAAQAYQALVDAPPARRRAIISGFIAPVMRFCGQVIVASAPGQDGLIVLNESKEAGSVAEQVRYGIDEQTGLTTSIERRATPLAAPEQTLTERWLLVSEFDRVS